MHWFETLALLTCDSNSFFGVGGLWDGCFFVGAAVLCIVGHLAAPLGSTHWMPVVPTQSWEPETALDLPKWPLLHKITPGWEPHEYYFEKCLLSTSSMLISESLFPVNKKCGPEKGKGWIGSFVPHKGSRPIVQIHIHRSRILCDQVTVKG